MQITGEGGLSAALTAEWLELWRADECASPFTSPQWCLPWWEHWRQGGDETWCLAAHENGRLVGLAPLIRRRRGPLRMLYGMGSGVGNYWDVVARPEHRAAVTAAIASHLRERSSQWDALSLDRLPPQSQTGHRLRAGGLEVRARKPHVAPAIDLPPTWDEYVARLTRNRRRKLAKQLDPLDSGELSFTTLTDPDQVSVALRQWQALRIAWWGARGRTLDPEHASERFLCFTTHVMHELIAAGLGSVHELRRGDQLLAVTANLETSNTFYAWLDGTDPAHESIGLGHIIVGATIRASIEAGRSTYDFMLGTEEYKYSYGAVDRALPNVLVSNGHPRSRLVTRVHAIRAGIGKAEEPAT